jgi:polysaccharide biosynthesis/export protein
MIISSQKWRELCSLRVLWGATLLALFMLAGCASNESQRSSGELMSQVQAEAKKTTLQEQLLAQVNESTLRSYKDYKVGPEDLLEVTFFGMDELNRDVRVNGHGAVSLPLVGPVSVAGLSPQEVESRLFQFYKDGKFIRNPQISVQVKEYRHQRVMVSGAVMQPGSFEVIGPRTLLEMLGKAGGLSEKAGDRVHIIRQQSAAARTKVLEGGASYENQGKETIVIDLRRLLVAGDLNLNMPIKNGDVVYVPPAKSAFVLGAVKKPGQVPVKENLTVTKALALTEGLDPLLASNRISILRQDSGGEVSVIPVDLGQVKAGNAPDPLLNENDVVFVSESGVKKFLFLFRNLMPGSFGMSAAAF